MNKVIKKILFYIILVVIWEVIYRVCVEYLHIWKEYSFSSPGSVFMSLIKLIKDNTLEIAILISLKRVFIGYFISLVIGIILGGIAARFKYFGNNIGSLFLGLQTLPNVCWIPFAILWYGLNESAIIFVVAIGSTFSVAIAVESGIKNISPMYIKVAKTMGARGLGLYKDIILPAAFPNIISGMKQGWSFAWRALMAGEMLSASIGLGQLLVMGREVFDMSQVIAIMITIITIGTIVDKLVFVRIELRVRYRWGLQQKLNEY
jgi:NitT/TauT family transport system permease protein